MKLEAPFKFCFCAPFQDFLNLSHVSIIY